MKLTIKENSKNYVCSVVEIKQVFDIENADNIKKVIVQGNSVVVSKDVKQGDRMLYFVSGTKLSVDYCKENSLYDKEELNKDTTKKGFISSRQSRVKAIKLRGIISDGMLMPLISLGENVANTLKVGDEFTDIDGVSICEKFIPIVLERTTERSSKKGKQAVKINRLVEEQFYLHNDTSNFRKNTHKIEPNNIVGIHFKKHGTSIVIGNVLVNRQLSWLEKIAKKLKIKVQETNYDIVYSSRKVIKNQYLNLTQNKGYYGEDIWGVVAKEVGHLIPKNWTLYGEVIGYTQSGSAIQAKYDYGCEVGNHKFYVYKISVVNEDGKVTYLTDKQIEEYCEKVEFLYKDTFIYYGYAKDLYPQLCTDEHWQDNFLAELEKDYNEKDCYMCKNKVPEEGIIIRKESMYEYEAYKLKSKRFLLAESEEQEKEIINIEDTQNES